MNEEKPVQQQGKKRITTFGPDWENKHSRILIDSLATFTADCRNLLRERLFIDLDSGKMLSLLFWELDHAKGQVLSLQHNPMMVSSAISDEEVGGGNEDILL